MSDQGNLKTHYFNSKGEWTERPVREPFVLFFGLPLVDRWFKEKYIRMYVNRYELGGNKNIVVDKDFKTEHASYNDLLDDVLSGREEECKVGGEMQIAALAAAHVLDKSGSVATVGAVGDDIAKTVCMDAMKEAGITPLYKVLENEGTGFRVTYDKYDMLTSKLQCCRYTAPRAAAEYEPEDFKEKDTEAAIAKTSWLYLDGGSIYADFDAAHGFLTEQRDAAVTLAERVANDGQRIVFNVSFGNLVEDAEFLWRDLVTRADVIIMNKETAEAFWQQEQGEGSRDWEQGALLVANHRYFTLNERYRSVGEEMMDRIQWVVVTRGAEDVAVIEGHPEQKKRTKISYVKIPPVEEPDHTSWAPTDRRGVGDLFAGGLVAGLAKGQTVEEAVLTGHKLAAYSMTQEGPKLPPKGSA